MSIYAELALLWAIVVYIVDLSGWTDTWLGWLSRFTARFGYPTVKELKPFSCSTCMVWWCCIAWAWYAGQLSILILAYIAGLSFLSITLRELFIFIRETFTNSISKVNKWLNG